MQSADAVLVHGAGGGGWEWTIWRRVFAANGWRCAAPDLQPVAAGLASTRFADYVDQVVATARMQRDEGPAAARGRGPVLIGASLGGLLVLAATADVAPAGLVLINPLSPEGSPDSFRENVDGIVPWGSRRSLASTMRALPDGDDAARLFAFRRWRDESVAVLHGARSGIPIAKPDCPVLVLASERDDDVPSDGTRRLAGLLDAEFRLVAEASHVGPLLGREAAAVALAAFAWARRHCCG